MRKAALLVLLPALFLAGAASAATTSTIVTHEEDKYFFQNGRMERFEGQYENTYFYDPEKSVLVRTRIYDYRTKKITPDDTHYQIQRQLNSDPVNAARYSLPSVLRAVGQPDPDTMEILVIRDDAVQTTVSHPGRIVVTNCRRLR
ncbi:MAG TPA: hypothetical protein VL404_01305 [Candidatus Eisenbacteria bacterium]|jgi:hypothetical protein|nr:hypothetical protein [Candidatus Eisenbacteria bacterium]